MKKIVTATITARTLANLLGGDANKELNDLIALYELIDVIEDFQELDKKYEESISWDEINNNSDFTINFEDCFPVYYSYNSWFKEVFIIDYNLALKEVEEQTIPSDRELCILRLAREAANKYIDTPYLYKFCREYLANTEENTIFWTEYCFTKNNQ